MDWWAMSLLRSKFSLNRIHKTDLMGKSHFHSKSCMKGIHNFGSQDNSCLGSNLLRDRMCN